MITQRKTVGALVGALVAIGVVSTPVAFADTGRSVTVRGTVVDIQEVDATWSRGRHALLKGNRGWRRDLTRAAGLRLVVETAEGEVAVHIPSARMTTLATLGIRVDDQLEIVGTATQRDGIRARQVTKADRVVGVTDLAETRRMKRPTLRTDRLTRSRPVVG